MIYAGRNKLESARTTREEGNNELSATVSNLARRWWRSKKHSKGSNKETNSLMAVDTMKQQLTKVLSDDEALINKKLPKELLLRIFSYLDVVSLCRCAQVSKAWNILALDGSNWQRIDLFDFQKDVEGPIIENISRRCGGFLRQLSLRGCQSIADGSMKTLAQLCPNVEDLNLNGCKKLTDASCIAFSKHCSKLQKLNLDSCSAITDNSLKALSDGCPNLTHINISWCSNITENGVEALARGCRKLKSFISKGCKQITSRAVICLARFCDQLEIVNLLGCSNIRDEAVLALAEKCPKLHYLCLSGCSALTDASLIALAQKCPFLSTLEVAGCSQFTDAAFQALARSCRYLEKMDLDECILITDNTLIHLAMGCPRIEYLTLSHCELITDEGIRHLSMSPCAAENLTILELDNCPLVTDASLEHLISCHNLQRVELYDCQLITRVGIRRLRSHLPNIKVHAYFAPVTPPPSAGGSRQRKIVAWVELNKINKASPDVKNGLKNVNSNDWPASFEKYKQELCAPNLERPEEQLQWLLGYAVQIESHNNRDLYIKHAVENLKVSSVPNVVTENPLDKLDFRSKDFAEGITNMAKQLNITPHPDPLVTLQAVAKLFTTRLSPQAQANPSEVIIKGTPFPFQDADLGFDLNDPVLNQAAKVLRILYIHDLRALQTSANELIVAVQNVTANPKTDTKLGKVGK